MACRTLALVPVSPRSGTCLEAEIRPFLPLILLVVGITCQIALVVTIRRRRTRLHGLGPREGEPSHYSESLSGETGLAHGFTIASAWESLAFHMVVQYALVWYPRTVLRAEPERLRMHRIGQFAHVHPDSYHELPRGEVTGVRDHGLFSLLLLGRGLLRRYTVETCTAGEFALILVWRDPGPWFGLVSPAGATPDGTASVHTWLEDVMRESAVLHAS
ncbi:MAG: hypothetical protein ABGY41_15840 [Candidatus Poribacteria bacterium]